MEVFLKDSGAVVDFNMDWGASYLQAGEIISTSSWTIWPTGAVDDLAVEQEPPLTGSVATVFVTKGILNHRYQLTNRITTDQGRTDERSFTVRIVER